MKRFLLSAFLLVVSLIVFSQSRYWVGSSGGLWSAPSNWSTASGGSGGASSPTSINDVVFDNGFSGTVEMDLLSTTAFTINSLLITQNSLVTLQRTQPGGGTRIFQLASTSSSTKGLQIDNGSTLIFDAVNSTGTLDYILALTGGPGVTGEVSGNLYIKGTGTGTGGAEIDLQDDATHYADLVVKNPGVIKYFDNTSNTSPATGSYLTMENGSIYEIEKNGGSFPPGVWAPNSLAKLSNATGINPAIFNGIEYGNLDWNCPNQNNYSLTNDLTFNNINLINTKGGASAFRITNTPNGNRSLTINGNLTIGNNAKLEITGVNVVTGGGKLILKGNLDNQGVLTTNGIINTINELQIVGTLNQNIASTGSITGKIHTILYNPAGVTLTSPVTLPYTVTFYYGKIKTTTSNILTFSELSTYAGASSLSFVEGPMRKIGATDFTFPIGVGSIYAPLTYNFISGGSTTDIFTAEYVRNNPQSSVGNVYGVSSNIDHISFVEYWKLIQDNGSATVSVALTVNPESFCRNMSSTFIGRYDPSAGWKNEGGVILGTPSPLPGSYESGTIRTGNDISDFGYFTLATTDPFVDNPLPINLLVFNATKISNTKAMLDWELAQCCSSAAKFEIERAGENHQFLLLGTVGGSEINRFYSLPDNDLKTGVNYYRLKMTDADGTVSYSRIVAVLNGVKDLLLTAVPTVVRDNISLTFTSSGLREVNIVVVDLTGRVIKKMYQQVGTGNTNISLSLGDLQNGAYLLYGETGDGKTNVIRLIKQ